MRLANEMRIGAFSESLTQALRSCNYNSRSDEHNTGTITIVESSLETPATLLSGARKEGLVSGVPTGPGYTRERSIDR